MDSNRFRNLCMQGDVLGALEYLDEFEGINKELIDMKNKYRERFISKTEEIHIDTDDIWIKGVLDQYYEYYRMVLTGNAIQSAEQRLLQDLLPFVNEGEAVGMDEVEDLLCERFSEKGYSFLGGRTLPYLGPYVWKTNRKETFKVKLVDSEQPVTVYFMSDFLMQSWMHFVTFGEKYAGGWAKEDSLYCVDNGGVMSDVTSEIFQVSYLKHEAQHLSDYKEFPNIKPWELEYRAKCVELIYYSRIHELLGKFVAEAKDNEAFPHAYAAYRIVRNLSEVYFLEDYIDDIEMWKTIQSLRLRETVTELYKEDTKQRIIDRTRGTRG